jgi:hypothetical protein
VANSPFLQKNSNVWEMVSSCKAAWISTRCDIALGGRGRPLNELAPDVSPLACTALSHSQVYVLGSCSRKVEGMHSQVVIHGVLLPNGREVEQRRKVSVGLDENRVDALWGRKE